MSTAVEIDGVNLVSIKEAASTVSYSRDYVARLAREGKIVASQIGRQWYVDVDSLRKFSAEVAVLEEARKEELRAERKRELMAKEALTALDVRLTKRTRTQRLDATAVAVAVLLLGFFAGAGLYTVSLLPHAKLALLSESLPVATTGKSALEVTAPSSDSGSPFRVMTEPTETLLLTTVTERPVFTTEAEVVPMEGGLEGILLFANEGAVRDAATVEQFFADPVEVEFTSERSGVITLSGEAGEATLTYPFVTLPVMPEANAASE